MEGAIAGGGAWNAAYQPGLDALKRHVDSIELAGAAKIAMNNTIRGLSSLPVILSYKKPGHTLHPDL